MRVSHIVCVCSAMLAFPAGGFQADQAEKMLATAEHEAEGVKVDLLEVKRDSPTVVTVRWRYRNETSEPKRLTNKRSGWYDPYRLSSESYLLDEVKQIKFDVSKDSDRRPVASRNGQPNAYIVVRPKGKIEVWAKYIVPESVTTVTVSIQGVRPLSGIAITK